LTPVQVATLLKVFTSNVGELGGNRQALAAFDAMRGIFEGAVGKGAGLVAFGD